MSVKCLNHVGIAVRSIDEQKAYYETALGLEFEGAEDVPSQKVRVAFYRAGDVRIELLEPTEPDSSVAKFLEKRGEGVHHITLQTPDLERKVVKMEADGVRIVDKHLDDPSFLDAFISRQAKAR